MWISTWKQASLYYANRIPFFELSAFPFSVPSNPTQPNPIQPNSLIWWKTKQHRAQTVNLSKVRLDLLPDLWFWNLMMTTESILDFVQTLCKCTSRFIQRLCPFAKICSAKLRDWILPPSRAKDTRNGCIKHNSIFFSLQSIENLYPKFILTQPKCRNSPITLFNFHIEIGLSVIIKEAEK